MKKRTSVFIVSSLCSVMFLGSVGLVGAQEVYEPEEDSTPSWQQPFVSSEEPDQSNEEAFTDVNIIDESTLPTEQTGPAAPATKTGGQEGTKTGGQELTAQSKIQNPLKGVDSLAGFFYLIANFVYSLSYIVIALFLILSGFKFVVAQGSPTKLEDAKKTFYYTIIGAILLIGAQVITKVVETIIKQVTNI